MTTTLTSAETTTLARDAKRAATRMMAVCDDWEKLVARLNRKVTGCASARDRRFYAIVRLIVELTRAGLITKEEAQG